MRKIAVVAGAASTLLVAMALTGCGRATSGRADAGAIAAAAHYTPSAGAFAAVPAPVSTGAAVVDTCNLDAVNGAPTGSTPLEHDSTVTFTGWAADPRSGGVPPGVRLVLKGAQSYAVNAATGLPRPDVVAANHLRPAAFPGYSVAADLSAVVPGTYEPVVEFSVAGKPMRCTTLRPVTIR